MFIEETLFNFYLNRTRIVVHDFIEYIVVQYCLVHEDFAYSSYSLRIMSNYKLMNMLDDDQN